MQHCPRFRDSCYTLSTLRAGSECIMAPSIRTRRQFIASGIAVGVGFTAGCISATEDTRPFDTLIPYPNEEYSYTVSHPASWSIQNGNPRVIEFTTDPFDGQMSASAHEPVDGVDSELTADVWHGNLSRYPEFKSIDKQFIEVPSGHTGVVLDTQYHNGEHIIREKTIFIVDRYTHAISVAHITDAFSGKFETMATAIVGSLTIG